MEPETTPTYCPNCYRPFQGSANLDEAAFELVCAVCPHLPPARVLFVALLKQPAAIRAKLIDLVEATEAATRARAATLDSSDEAFRLRWQFFREMVEALQGSGGQFVLDPGRTLTYALMLHHPVGADESSSAAAHGWLARRAERVVQRRQQGAARLSSKPPSLAPQRGPVGGTDNEFEQEGPKWLVEKKDDLLEAVRAKQQEQRQVSKLPALSQIKIQVEETLPERAIIAVDLALKEDTTTLTYWERGPDGQWHPWPSYTPGVEEMSDDR